MLARAGEFSVVVVRRLTRPLSFPQKVAVAQFANETVGRPCGPRVSLIMASVNAGDLCSKLACEQCFEDSYERCVLSTKVVTKVPLRLRTAVALTLGASDLD